MSQVPTGRLIAADDDGLSSMMQRMASILEKVPDGEDIGDYVARAADIIRDHVRAIADVFADADAFDVTELFRLRETPMTLDGYRESLSDQLPAVIDIVAIILMARGYRVRDGADPREVRPAAAVSPVHERCEEILTLAAFTSFDSGQRNEFGPLTQLAAEYVTQDLFVRNKQYLHIHDSIDAALFSTEHLGSLLLDALGFSYEDLLAVREAIERTRSEKFFAARDALGSIAEHWQRDHEGGKDVLRLEEGKRALSTLMEYPADRAAFSAAEMADASGVQLGRVEALLRTFSAQFDEQADPTSAVQAYLAGDNPLRHLSLIRDADGFYVSTGRLLGFDALRHVAELAFKKIQTQWRRYEKRRARASEELAVARVSQLLDSPTTHVNLEYFRANPGVEIAALGREASHLPAIAELTEADSLFIIEDVAICVEVKAKSISSQARRGQVRRLATDLRDTIGDATAQAMRLEDHIRANGGLWLKDRSWLDLSTVREVRSIAVCLDDFGPLATALDELVRGNVITAQRFPWIVSLHDLSVVAEVVQRPAEFLLYLRRRTESEVSVHFKAVDELDLFMLFLEGGLYVEPDPDRIKEEFLGVRRPTRGDRRRHKSAAVPTRVTTHTDSLDAWIYFEEGISDLAAPKPTLASEESILRVVDFLQAGRVPGWFRFAADLLNLSEDAQEGLAQSVAELLDVTTADRQHHQLFLPFPGAWGYPCLFVGTRPSWMSSAEASRRLATYGVLKKHQIKSDRALMVLLDESGRIRSVRYDNAIADEDARLDEAGKLLGLMPPETMARPIPPSARRETKRLNPTSKRRGGRR